MMKTIFTIFILVTSISKLFSQSPTIQWQKTYGGTNIDVANIIKKTTDGGYIFLGSTSSKNGDVTEMKGVYDFWVVKISGDGAIQWQKTLGGEDDERSRNIKQTHDGGYIVVGNTDSTTGDITNNHGKSDLWIIKLNSNGNVEWQKTYGGSSYDDGYDIIQTNDGGFAVAGHSRSIDGDLTGLNNADNNDIWLLKIDNIGNIMWQKMYGGTGDDQGRKIYQTADNGFIIGGETTSTNGDVSYNHGYYDYWAIKLNNLGAIEWQKTYGGIGQDSLMDILPTTDGGYILSGFSSSKSGDVSGNHGSTDVWVVKISNSGNMEWQKSLGGTKTELGYEIIQTTDGGYLQSAWAESNDGDVTDNHGQMDGWLVKLDKLGNIQWQKTLGGTGYDWVQSTVQTEDGFITAGYNGSFGNAWVLKLGPDLMATLDLLSNKNIIYPNPVKEKFIINTNDKIEKVEIYSQTGQLLKTEKSKEINISNLPKGNYLVKIKTDKDNVTQKIIKE